MSTNTFRKIKWTAIYRYTHREQDGGTDTDPAFRVYKSSPDRVTLQVRGQLLLDNGEPGAYGIVASAMLDHDELTALRDGINASLADLP